MTSNNISSSRKSKHVDIHLGKRLKQRRVLLGLTQMELANKLGISYQQIQKYEKAADRVSASRLVDISNVLGINIMYFFNGLPEKVLKQSPKTKATLDKEATENTKDDAMTQRETLTLVRNYCEIADKKERNNVMALCKALAKKN